MSEEAHKACHPWVRTTDFANYVGKPVAFVGTVKSSSGGSIVLSDFNNKEVTVSNYDGESVEGVIEVRGVLKDESTIEFG